MLDLLLRVPGSSMPRLQRLTTNYAEPLDEYWAAPWRFMDKPPDKWQRRLLSNPCANWLLNCSRQSGKTEVVAVQALWESLCCGSFVMIISRSEKQAYEFLRRVKRFYVAHPLVDIVAENMSEMEFENGGRILALPNNEATVRVYSSVNRLIVDEASRVPDALYGAVCPMLAVAKGRQTVLSTPFGKRGWYYREWTTGTTWHRHEAPWQDCPRIEPSFIDEERQRHGDLWVSQEYCCKFLSVSSSYFDVEGFDALIDYEGDGYHGF